MSENNGLINKTELGGSISYSEDVIAIISGLAATEIEGVAGMSGGIKSGIGELLGRKDLAKGIRASIQGDEAVIEVNLIASYGALIHQVAQEVQKNVKRAVENMTGLRVTAVNINVQGVQVTPENNK